MTKFAMFGAEPFEPLSKEEAEDFETYAAAQLKACVRDAVKAAILFGIIVLTIVPFSAGHRFHNHWAGAKYLVFLAMASWLWLVLKVGLVWSSWQSTRETRREFTALD